jgi:hypothetical protein
MNAKKLTAAIAATALVVSVPLATLYAGPAVAAQHHAMGTAAARAAATSRLSGLPFGGAALYDPQTAPPMNAAATTNAERAARAAATSRLSGLPFGGAALDL